MNELTRDVLVFNGYASLSNEADGGLEVVLMVGDRFDIVIKRSTPDSSKVLWVGLLGHGITDFCDGGSVRHRGVGVIEAGKIRCEVVQHFTESKYL